MRAKRCWQVLIRLVYPHALKCPRCGRAMKFLGVITEVKVIRPILEYLGRWSEPFPPEEGGRGRDPPSEEAGE